MTTPVKVSFGVMARKPCRPYLQITTHNPSPLSLFPDTGNKVLTLPDQPHVIVGLEDTLLPTITVETLRSTVKNLAVTQMESALDALSRELNKLRTGRAGPGPFRTSLYCCHRLADVSCFMFAGYC